MTGELDEFRLVRPLGRGGMGEVYLGHDTVLDRPVAIKLIGARNPDAASRERFLIEARAIARLSHPNVVTIYRVGATADGRPFLVQELIRGKSLDQLPRPVPWQRVCELGIGIARGLEAAHRRGILHRDVKPANVMLDEHGAPRLLDFGLAKLTGEGEGLPGPDESGAAAGPRLEGLEGLEGTATEGSPGSGSDVAETAAGPASASDRGVAETADSPAPAPALAPIARGVAETADSPALAPIARDAAAISLSGSDSIGAAHRIRPASGPGFDAGLGAGFGPAAGAAPTEPGTVLGTPRYTAPERWRGEPASARSDIYSLGAMLYELLAGVAPHPQADLAELQAAAQSGYVRPLIDVAPDAAPALARLVMRCLALEPRDRPESAAAVAHDLATALAGVPSVPEGNPYRGLRAFDAEHRALFFGRGADVDAIVDRLRTEPLVAVASDSGIGKSSVCHAGVVPAVAAGALGDRRAWRAVAIVPGRAPWTALCDALAISGRATEDAGALLGAARPAGDGGLLLVIDQLEELVTLAAPAEAARVAELLAAIAGGGAPGVKALLAVRGDFLTRLAALPELGAPLARGLYLLRPLAAPDLREAIAGPARATGVRFEAPAMIDELAGAVAGNPGALPLLSFTLAELWQARDEARGVIPAGALERLGGVDGALAGHADAVLLALPPGPRAAARRILLRLVTEARTRAVRDRDELAGGTGGEGGADEDAVAAPALEALVRGRLVVARDTAAGAPSYELAHEALIRGWGTLRGWLDEETGHLAARDRLRAGAAEWHRLGYRDDLLWTRRQLDEVRDLEELTRKERTFVEASRRRVRRGRLARGAALAVVPLAALAIGGTWLVREQAREQALAALVDAVAPHRTAAVRLSAEAIAARTEAFRRFDAGDPAGGEREWARARARSEQAHEAYATAAAQLEVAFELDRAATGGQLAALLAEQIEFAEDEHDDARAAALLRRLGRYDPARAASFHAPGRIVIALSGQARFAIHAFRCWKGPPGCVPGGGGPTIAGGFDAAPVVEREGFRIDEELPPGSYVALIGVADYEPIRAPFVIRRGARRELVIDSAPLASPPHVPTAWTPQRFVYVPAGEILVGSGHDDGVRRNLAAEPLRRIYSSAFWIARTEVTYADWIHYLRDLPPDERRKAGPARPDVSLAEGPDGRFVLTLEPSPEQRYRAAEGERIVYPGRTVRREVRWEQLPVSGISYEAAVAYADWLNRTRYFLRARLCTAREWEHAARGADGRSFPHGRALAPGDANFDETYGRTPSAFGPDEVGSFPASDSPYGVADLAGNVWDTTTADTIRPTYKGGSFYQAAFAATAENLGNPGDPKLGNIRVGLRICADISAAR